ncbi:unnamed protein product [Scytosiphon promiscuus]
MKKGIRPNLLSPRGIAVEQYTDTKEEQTSNPSHDILSLYESSLDACNVLPRGVTHVKWSSNSSCSLAEVASIPEPSPKVSPHVRQVQTLSCNSWQCNPSQSCLLKPDGASAAAISPAPSCYVSLMIPAAASWWVSIA